MIYELETPYLGATHVRYEQVEDHEDRLVLSHGRYGVLDGGGAFHASPSIGPEYRTIEGSEFQAFLDSVVERGLPSELRGEWRTDDLLAWLDEWGYCADVCSWEDSEEGDPE